mmetsp:Transcript_34442/g.39248  ORF Transcript_34442/g.39248 Transcript_34442/m.39248 type:complete len:500 (+) Transcript_34442:345-1844(+)
MEETSAIETHSPTNTDIKTHDKLSESSTLLNETEADFTEDILRKLSQQLEYYFSTENLSKDTYLRTLRELNDGYVPASILANFGKVRLLLQQQHNIKAVVKAASYFSSHLEVVHVDKESSEKVLETEGRQTILAIGPKNSKPIDIDMRKQEKEQPSTFATNNSTGIPNVDSLQNTVILRDVPCGVTEDDIRKLFNFEQCPSIQSIREDVASCWFVTMNPTSRDDMLNVMLALRSKKLKGEDIKARLKSGSTIVPPSATYSTNLVYVGDRNFLHHNKRYGGRFKGKYNQAEHERRHLSGSKKNRSRNQQRGSSGSSGQNQRELSRVETSNKFNRDKNLSVPPSPPQLVGPHFPALEPSMKAKNDINVAKSSKFSSTNNKQQTDDEEDAAKTPLSDAASTATTSTSSFVENGLVSTNEKGGYAAALLKNPPVGNKSKSTNSKPIQKEVKPEIETAYGWQNSQKDTFPSEVEHPSANNLENTVEEKLPSWGGTRRSFADILK